MRKTILLISTAIISFVIFVFVSCADTEAEKKQKLPPPMVETSETLEPEAIVEPTVDPVPVIPETNERPAGSQPWTTYWYVFYDVHIVKGDVRYNGYTIVALETNYFDIEQAIKQIVPTYVKEDYVGIQFFQQVPVETYKAYEKSNL